MADGVALRINRDPVSLLPEYTAKDERLLAALGMMPDQASGLASREGRRLGPGLECSISADGLSVVVQPGLAVVQHALSAGGDYHVAVPAQISKTLGAKPGAGQKRRDTVVIDVADEDVTEKPTALREANVQLLAGNPTSGSPVAPAAGVMQFEIARVHFDGANTPIIHPTNPRYTWAAGGIGKVYSEAERDGLEAYDGLVVYRADLNVYECRINGGWAVLFGQTEDTGWLDDTTVTRWNPFTIDGTQYRKVGNRVSLHVECVYGGATLTPTNRGNLSPDWTILTMPADFRPAYTVKVAGQERFYLAGGAVLPSGDVLLTSVAAGVPSVAANDSFTFEFDYFTD